MTIGRIIRRGYYRAKKSKFFLAFVVIAVVLVLLFNIWLATSSDVSRANVLKNNKLAVKLLPIYWQIRKLSDITYLPYYFKKNNLPTYEVKISKKNLKKLVDDLPADFMNVTYPDKIYVPAEVIYKGKTYKAEIRYRGDNAIHFNAPKKSYLIKFDKDDMPDGLRRLSFIILDDRHFVLEQFHNYRAGKLGLKTPTSFFANLKINGRNQGLYWVVENWSSAMLAKWEVPDNSNFYGHRDQETLSEVPISGGMWKNVNYWRLLSPDSRFNFKHFSEAQKLIEIMALKSDEDFFNSIFNLIDKDNFYAWQNHQTLIGSSHQGGPNTRLYFNNSSGKFYFVPWDVGVSYDISDNLNFYNSLAQRIFKNPKFVNEKNKRLYEYINDDKNLKDDLKFYDENYEMIKPALYQDRMKIFTNHWADSEIKKYRQLIISQIQAIKQLFKNKLIMIDVNVTDDNSEQFKGEPVLAYFDINTKQVSDFYLRDIKLEFVGDYKLKNYEIHNIGQLIYADRMAGLDTNTYNLAPTTHRFYLTSREMTARDFAQYLKSVDFEIVNDITGKKVKNKDLEIKYIDTNAFKHLDYISDVEKFKKDYPQFVVKEQAKEIILTGNQFVNKTVVVPAGYTLRIYPGAVLTFGQGVSLISYSSIKAKGAVFQGQNWGVVAVVNTKDESWFDNCQFIGGSDDYINGIYFSGMLSSYYSNLKINNSIFKNAAADDGLNVKSAVASIKNTQFINNYADAIDFDFVKNGEIISSEFIDNGNDSIDISGSSILIKNNYIKNSADKCISVGEKSINTIVYNNVLRGCDIGIEIKDLSDIIIINNVIINNRIGLNAYQKKAIFGRGIAEVYNSIIWDNEQDIKTDKKSEINVYNSDINELIGQNNNFSAEPVFSYDFTNSPKNGNILFINGGNSDILKEKLGIIQTTIPIGLNK